MKTLLLGNKKSSQISIGRCLGVKVPVWHRERIRGGKETPLKMPVSEVVTHTALTRKFVGSNPTQAIIGPIV